MNKTLNAEVVCLEKENYKFPWEITGRLAKKFKDQQYGVRGFSIYLAMVGHFIARTTNKKKEKKNQSDNLKLNASGSGSNIKINNEQNDHHKQSGKSINPDTHDIRSRDFTLR